MIRNCKMMRHVKSAVILISGSRQLKVCSRRNNISTQYIMSIYTLQMSEKKPAAPINGHVRRPALAVSVDSPQTREKASRFAILGMLALGKKQSGYDLKKAIDTSTVNFWSESYGNI